MNRSTDTVRGLTDLLHHSTSTNVEQLRGALRSQGIDPATAVLANWCPEGEAIDGPGTWESHHIVVVTPERRAFVGMLRIDHPDIVSLGSWQEVRAEPIEDAAELVALLSHNRRDGKAWNDGMPTWVDSPKDLIYHQLIAAGLDVLTDR